MKRILSLILASTAILSAGGCVQAPVPTAVSSPAEDVVFATDVILGDEQYESYLPLIEGKKVALFSNHTGIAGDKNSNSIQTPDSIDESLTPLGYDANGKELVFGKHILNELLERGVNVTAVFTPEHGFSGTADAKSTADESANDISGVPLIPLYGSNVTHMTSEDDMKKFDVLAVDIQDIGLRYYTYWLSMYHLMDACASHNKQVIIFDRPNPNGFYVDGPILRESFKSNIGELPIPTVHGMTLGELAQMINGEGWLSTGKNSCNLTVIPCKNYTHQKKTRLIMRPSPNIRDMRAVYLYASTCFFERTLVSVARGTDFPFEAYGSPYLEGIEGFDFTFTPVSMTGAESPVFLGEKCFGVDLRNIPIGEIIQNGIDLDYLISAYKSVSKTAPGKSFWGKRDKEKRYNIDKLAGTDEVRLQIESGMTAAEIKAGWQDDIQSFIEKRRPYLLYDE